MKKYAAAAALLLGACLMHTDVSAQSLPHLRSLTAPRPEDVPVFEVLSYVTAGDLLPSGAKPVKDFRYFLSRTGAFSIRISYYLDGEKYTDKFYFRAADTTAPVVLNSGDGSSVKKGSDFDIADYVGVGDKYDDNVTITYTGDLDTDTPGKYRITAHASDSSGNTTDWGLNVRVYEEGGSGGYEPSTPSFIPFDDFAAEYGDKGVLGIDISKWQGDVDFDRIRDAGCKFVMMRIGADTKGIYEDVCFRQNIEGAKAAGLKVGVYFYTDCDSEERVNEMCDWIIDTLDGASLDLPVSFDWEEFVHFQKYGISLHRLNELYGIFEDRMNAAGYEACLYGSKNYLNNVWEDADKVWLAHYTKLGKMSDYPGSYFMWQMCSDGRIDGIDGDVDFDVLMYD